MQTTQPFIAIVTGASSGICRITRGRRSDVYNTGLFQTGGPDAFLWKATGVTESVVVGVKR
jgi:hypothetical protein